LLTHLNTTHHTSTCWSYSSIKHCNIQNAVHCCRWWHLTTDETKQKSKSNKQLKYINNYIYVKVTMQSLIEVADCA